MWEGVQGELDPAYGKVEDVSEDGKGINDQWATVGVREADVDGLEEGKRRSSVAEEVHSGSSPQRFGGNCAERPKDVELSRREKLRAYVDLFSAALQRTRRR